MIFCIEGVDCTGKSTLARKLTATRGGEVVHAKAPERHPLDEYEDLIRAHDPAGEALVLDRWHWGERIWPEFFGRDSALTRVGFYHIELLMEARGAVMIHATGKATDIADRLRERGDDAITPEEVEGPWRRFLEVDRESILPVYRHVIGENEQPTPQLLGATEYRSRQAARVPRELEYIGTAQTAMTLFIGPDAAAPPHQVPANVGLLAALDSWEPPLNRAKAWIGVVSTPKTADEGRLYSLWQDLGAPPVVALGEEAEDVSARLKIPAASAPVPAPEYALAPAPAAYRDVLIRAAKEVS